MRAGMCGQAWACAGMCGQICGCVDKHGKTMKQPYVFL